MESTRGARSRLPLMGAEGGDAAFVLVLSGLAGTEAYDDDEEEEEDVDDDGGGGCMELFLLLLLLGGGATVIISFSVAGLPACESLEPYIFADVFIS